MREISDEFFHRDHNVYGFNVTGDTLNIFLRCLYSELRIDWVFGVGGLEGAKTKKELQAELQPLLDGIDSPFAKYMTNHLNEFYDEDGRKQGNEEPELVCVSCKATNWYGSRCTFTKAKMHLTYIEQEVVLKFKEK